MVTGDLTEAKDVRGRGRQYPAEWEVRGEEARGREGRWMGVWMRGWANTHEHVRACRVPSTQAHAHAQRRIRFRPRAWAVWNFAACGITVSGSPGFGYIGKAQKCSIVVFARPAADRSGGACGARSSPAGGCQRAVCLTRVATMTHSIQAAGEGEVRMRT